MWTLPTALTALALPRGVASDEVGKLGWHMTREGWNQLTKRFKKPWASKSHGHSWPSLHVLFQTDWVGWMLYANQLSATSSLESTYIYVKMWTAGNQRHQSTVFRCGRYRRKRIRIRSWRIGRSKTSAYRWAPKNQREQHDFTAFCKWNCHDLSMPADHLPPTCIFFFGFEFGALVPL